MKEFQSQVFCLTGAVPGFSRGDLWEHIAARDGEFSEHMNKSVTILVVGERGQGTSKYEKALQYDTEIMEYEQFLSWLWRTPVVDKDAHLRPLNRPRRIGGAHVIDPMTGQKNGLPWEEPQAREKVQEVQEAGDMSSSRHDSQPSTLNSQPSEDWHPGWAQETHTDSTDNTDSMVQGSRFKVQEALNAKPSTLNSKPSTLQFLSSLAAAIGTILIIIGKAVLFICGLSICVVLWLVGIPVKP